MVRQSPNKLITRREIQLTKLTTLENRLTTQEHSTKSGWGREMGRESIRNRRATRPPAHFQRNPPGRGQLAVFPSGGCRTRPVWIQIWALYPQSGSDRPEKQPTV